MDFKEIRKQIKEVLSNMPPEVADIKAGEIIDIIKKTPKEKEVFTGEKLDEKGFVFLDLENKPFWCRIWYDGNPWLFRWVNDGWVSYRQVTQTEIWMAYQRALSKENAKAYHLIHEKNHS